MSSFVIAWLPLSSTVDIQNKTVTAKITGFSSYALLYDVTTPANFKLSSLDISPTEARVGEEIFISTVITNMRIPELEDY